MVHDRLGPLILAVVMMAGLGPDVVRAAAINFTGNVVQDLANADPAIIPVNSSPQSLGEWPSSVTDNGTWVTGWNIKDIYLKYDSSTGTLYVGVNNWANASGQIAPFGQANGDPSGTATPYDPAHLGYGTPSSDKSIALAFAPINPANPSVPGTPVVIAGVPADKTKNGPGIDGFTVSSINNSQASGGVGYMFGQNLPRTKGTWRSIHARPSPVGVHDQELQPAHRPLQGLLDRRVCGLGRGQICRRDEPGLDKDSAARGAEHPGAIHLAGVVAGQRHGGMAIAQTPEPGVSLRFDPLSRRSWAHPCENGGLVLSSIILARQPRRVFFLRAME